MTSNLIRKANQAADFLNALLLGVITAGVIIAVFGRYLFGIPLPGLIEAAYFSMLCCMFLQTGKALHEGKHASTSLVTDRLPARVASVLGLVANTIILLCSIIFVYYCFRSAYDSYTRSWYHSGSFQVPMHLLYFIMSVGSLYMALIAFLKFIENVLQIKRKRAEHGV